ncbi:MAG: DedA family protein [Pseudomonadota bacterium]
MDEAFLGSGDYLAIGLAALVFPPETFLPLLGFLAQQGEASLPLALLASTIGGTASSSAIYLLARTIGCARFRRLLAGPGRRLRLKAHDLDPVLDLFGRHGSLLIVTGRAIPTVRSLVSVPAGLLPMPPTRFLLLTLLGTSLWNSLLVVAGYLLGAQWELLAPWLGAYGAGAAVTLIALAGWFLWRRNRRRWLARHSG